MKKIKIYAVMAMFLAATLGAFGQTSADEKNFQEIKLLIFDERWPEALAKLEGFLAQYPQSSYFSQAVYYKSKCLKELGGRETEALNSFKNYLQLKDINKNLAEDAEVSIIDQALDLYDKGNKIHIREIEDRLGSPNRVVRYYAAWQLSKVKDKKIAEKSVPVLKKILEEERNSDLRDRAKIALMRVSPEALAGIEEERSEKRPRILKIMVTDQLTKKIQVSLNIPWALADLALAAIPEEEKLTMRGKGYDIQRIMKELQSVKGNIVEIIGEGKIIKIWIE